MLDRWLARRRALRSPLVKIRDVREDAIVRVAGVARVDGDRVLRAPVSERVCLGHAATVYVGLSRTFAGTDVECVPFLLADDGDVALVDPAPAMLRMRDVFTLESDAAPDLPRRRLLERLGVIGPQWYDTMYVMYEETVVLADRQVIVAGAATHQVDPRAAAGYRDHVMRVRLGSTRELDVIITEPRRRGA